MMITPIHTAIACSTLDGIFLSLRSPSYAVICRTLKAWNTCLSLCHYKDTLCLRGLSLSARPLPPHVHFDLEITHGCWERRSRLPSDAWSGHYLQYLRTSGRLFDRCRAGSRPFFISRSTLGGVVLCADFVAGIFDFISSPYWKTDWTRTTFWDLLPPSCTHIRDSSLVSLTI